MLFSISFKGWETLLRFALCCFLAPLCKILSSAIWLNWKLEILFTTSRMVGWASKGWIYLFCCFCSWFIWRWITRFHIFKMGIHSQHMISGSCKQYFCCLITSSSYKCLSFSRILWSPFTGILFAFFSFRILFHKQKTVIPLVAKSCILNIREHGLRMVPSSMKELKYKEMSRLKKSHTDLKGLQPHASLFSRKHHNFHPNT